MTDLSPEAKALVDLARDGDEPAVADRARVRRALAAGLAAGVTGSSLSAAAASKSALGIAGSGTAAKTTIGLWLAAGAVVGLAGSAALFVAGSAKGPSEVPAVHAPVRTANPSAATRATSARAAATGDVERAVPSPVEREAEPNPVVAAPAGVRTPESSGAAGPSHIASSQTTRLGAPPVAARALTTGPEPASPATDIASPTASSDGDAVRTFPVPRPSTLGAETTLLEGARTALGRGDPANALAFLERHEREFPGGSLVEERLAAKVFALCGLGRRGEAVRTAARLLAASPNSPLRARVLDSCAYRP